MLNQVSQKKYVETETTSKYAETKVDGVKKSQIYNFHQFLILKIVMFSKRYVSTKSIVEL